MTNLTHSTAPGADHFTAIIRRRLLSKGIAILGTVAIPDMTSSMPWANPSRAYSLNDNGTGCIRTYAEVEALAKG
jgi:hypothetical protein